ncbi:hypothetical protein Ocin01_14602 [Orchesella cincta]|uniref:Uncharacterized protein n=1 Tax=Orchesella cincta TaxID=48709 RepID=A0A1D2MGI2_ORCCI|nr:hypothetical protein Ocin01_14602 [Orchesella cincta]
MPPFNSERKSSCSNQGELDDSQKLTAQLFSYWRIPLVTSFYLLITPFHIEFIDTENFHVHTCFIQKVFHNNKICFSKKLSCLMFSRVL